MSNPPEILKRLANDIGGTKAFLKTIGKWTEDEAKE